MRPIRLIAEDAAARRPVVKNTKAETVRTIKKPSAKLLIELGCRSKFVVEPVHKNSDVALLLVLRRVMRRKFIRGSNQKFLEIGSRNFPPVIDISQRLLIADPEGNPIGVDVGSNALLAPIIDHPILW